MPKPNPPGAQPYSELANPVTPALTSLRALERFTDAVYDLSKAISSYRICADLPDVDLSLLGRHTFASAEGEVFFEVEVIDPASDYVALLRQVFDFDALRGLLARPDMSVVMDGMSGVAGPYAKARSATPRPLASTRASRVPW